MTVNTASEYRYDMPAVTGRTLAVPISQSGETADTLAALRLAKKSGIKTAAIVNAVGSAAAREADFVMYTGAGPERAVATTRGYTTQVAVLTMLALFMAERLGRIGEERYTELVRGIVALPERCQRAIDLNLHIDRLAKR